MVFCGGRIFGSYVTWVVALFVFLAVSYLGNSALGCARGQSCPESLTVAIFLTYTTVNSWAPDFLKQGYTPPVWPKWVPPDVSNECRVEPDEWLRGQFHSLVELLAFERARLARNITVYELGCGGCQLCCKLNTVRGLRCVGVDIADASKTMRNYMKHDLTQFLQIDEADYILTFENAEHIPPEFEDNYIKTLVQAKVGLIVAWARPGQGGMGHFNERSLSHVKDKIESASSFRVCERRTYEYRKDIHRGLKSMFHRQNPQLFFQGTDEAEFRSFCDQPLDPETEMYVVLLLCIVGCCCLIGGFCYRSGNAEGKHGNVESSILPLSGVIGNTHAGFEATGKET